MGTFEDCYGGFRYIDDQGDGTRFLLTPQCEIEITEERGCSVYIAKPDIPELISRLAKLAGVRIENIEYEGDSQ